jgi:hypothetical protein
MNAATTLPTSAQNRTAWRRALLLMVALSLLPIAIGTGLYLIGWRPAKTSNYGTLITPPSPIAIDAPTGRWSLVLIGDGVCDAACSARLDELRRVRVSLAKEMHRIQLLRVAPPAALADLPAGTVIIVDPDSRAMMRYAPGAEAKGLRADLERLLKYSWTG